VSLCSQSMRYHSRLVGMSSPWLSLRTPRGKPGPASLTARGPVHQCGPGTGASVGLEEGAGWVDARREVLLPDSCGCIGRLA
jgi:hypothetical protein